MIVTFSGRPGSGKTAIAKYILEKRPESAEMLKQLITRVPSPLDIEGEYIYLPPPRDIEFHRFKTGKHFLWVIEEERHTGIYLGLEKVAVIRALSNQNTVHGILLPPNFAVKLASYAEERGTAENTIMLFYIHVSEEILAERLHNRGLEEKRIRRILDATKKWDKEVKEGSSSPFHIVDNGGETAVAARYIRKKIRGAMADG